jgi:hypothetical protein
MNKNLVKYVAWGIAGYAAYQFLQKLIPGVQSAVNQATSHGNLTASQATSQVVNATARVIPTVR